MHRILSASAIAALTAAGVLVATTPPDDTPGPDTTVLTETTVVMQSAPETSTVDSVVSEPDTSDVAAAAGDATVYDESGNPVASITLVSSETAWGDYEEGNDPEAGREYVRVVVSVASLITDGTFGINVDDFILQDNNGFVTNGESVATAAQADADEDLTEEAELANSESVELTITFEVVSSVGPKTVYYRPDDERLVDVADIG